MADNKEEHVAHLLPWDLPWSQDRSFMRRFRFHVPIFILLTHSWGLKIYMEIGQCNPNEGIRSTQRDIAILECEDEVLSGGCRRFMFLKPFQVIILSDRANVLNSLPYFLNYFGLKFVTAAADTWHWVFPSCQVEICGEGYDDVISFTFLCS